MNRLGLLLLITLAACASPSVAPQTLTIMTHDSFAVTDSLIRSFEKLNNAKLAFLGRGDAGAALNKAILSKKAPLADVCRTGARRAGRLSGLHLSVGGDSR